MKRKGFTLIEVMIAVAVVGLLSAAILAAVDPVRRIGEARNAHRLAVINGMINALLTKHLDDRTAYNGDPLAPLGNTGTTQVIVASHIIPPVTNIDCSVPSKAPACPYATGAAGRPSALATAAGTGCIADLSGLVTGTYTYLAEIPQDPIGGTPTAGYLPIGANNSGYYIVRSASGRTEIGSCYPNLSADIKISR